MIRAVLDTNLLVSALLFGGIPQQVYQAGINGLFTMLCTEPLYAELAEVITRPKFSERLARRIDNPDLALVSYQSKIEVVAPAVDLPAEVIRDPKDRMVLACAVAGKADYVVSGDQDLLVLGHFRTIPILTAAAFLERLTSPPENHPTPPLAD